MTIVKKDDALRVRIQVLASGERSRIIYVHNSMSVTKIHIKKWSRQESNLHRRLRRAA